MAVIAACAALVLLGVALIVRWGGDPPPRTAGAPQPVRRRIGVALAAGLVAGVLAAGAGGRLVMRLLAVTSPEAEGTITEADEVVGEISVEGTLGLIIFAGLPAGFLSGLLYALVRPLLPSGRWGGVVLGALLLVLAGSTVEPLRADNIDFVLVGPPWLAVLSFTALALLHGMLVVAVGARLSPPPAVATSRPRLVTIGRIAVGVAVLAALPGFVSAVADILAQG